MGRAGLAIAASSILILGALSVPAVQAAPEDVVESIATSEEFNEPPITRLIVKYKNNRSPYGARGQVIGQDKVPNIELISTRKVGLGATVVGLEGPVTPARAELLAQRIANDPRVEWAEPDGWAFPTAYPSTPPNDSRYVDLWGLWDTHGVGIGTDATTMSGVWAETQGEDVVVAVLDTGSLAHPDLDGQYVTGYDFVSSGDSGYLRFVGATQAESNEDGDALDVASYGGLGWDSNPLDPGTWFYYLDETLQIALYPSSWHGTHVSGTIAANSNNALGVTGVTPRSKIQPIRVLSWLGGAFSDIATAIAWASGANVSGVPTNQTPADVINLSLGGVSQCPNYLQSAISVAKNRGSTVVVAAGNNNRNAMDFTPANCGGVITVAATAQDGSRAEYSNFGSAVEIAAPGGDFSRDTGIISTVSSTATGPGDPNYAGGAPVPSYEAYQGTSMAAPHVSGVAALIKSKFPNASPSDVEQMLLDSVRPFSTGACIAPETCGLGIVDARFLAAAAPASPVINGISPSSGDIAGGTTVDITGQNFSAVTNVFFGDTPAVAIDVVSDSTVRAITPSRSAGIVTVTLQTLNTTTTTNQAFTFVAPVIESPPPIDVVVPTPQPQPEPVVAVPQSPTLAPVSKRMRTRATVVLPTLTNGNQSVTWTSLSRKICTVKGYSVKTKSKPGLCRLLAAASATNDWLELRSQVKIRVVRR